MNLRDVPENIRLEFAKSDAYFQTQIQKFMFYDKYSRFDYDLGRRETWIEAVDRAVDFLIELSESRLSDHTYERIRQAILEMKVMPSMRLMAMAGPAARRNNITIYNCSYMPVESIHSFVEALIISMSGSGVGYSVEWKYVKSLPIVKMQNGHCFHFEIEDSTKGWADALYAGLNAWFEGQDIEFDFSLLRPAGAPLRIKGGRASGPAPLKKMLEFVRMRILARQNTFLRPIDAHDIMCMAGDAAVSGGIRRTAMIALFDYDDEEMRSCKDGDFEKYNSQRWNANNSAVWPMRRLTQAEVSSFFLEMVKSNRGEPGIFNRRAAIATSPSRREKRVFGTNPCGEIILRPWQFCNLASAVARADDTLESLKEKVEIAATIGTIQSLATNFPGLRPIWKQNCEEERLVGVDLNGQLDSLIAQEPNVQKLLKQVAINTNRRVAKALGINQATAVTCVKPSGNSAQLLNCSSGIHARWSRFYIRNIRVGAHSTLFKVLKNASAPMDPENGQDKETALTWVIHFPVKAPEGAIIQGNISAISQCNYWRQNKICWTEHNPSVTITYNPDEVIDLMKWIWEHQDEIGGMAFLPSSDAKYDQMPYVEISEDEYNQLEFPVIDFSEIYGYEKEDLTTTAQELACSAGKCDI